MKVCVITFCDNGNYGSELQAIAMNEFLKEQNHEVTFVKIKYKNRLLRALQVMYIKVKDFYFACFDNEYRDMRSSLLKNGKKKMVISSSLRLKIKKLVNEMINVEVLNIGKFRNKFDCYICGSDQIWSPAYIPFNKNLYLCSIIAEKKIAYAPSFGINTLPNYHIKKAIPLINEFKYLSVREVEGASLIQQYADKKANVVVDPTLLVNSSIWNQMADLYNENNIHGDYVFCYFLGEISSKVKEKIRDYSNGARIIMVPYKNNVDFDMEYLEANPAEFLSLIKKAKYIFTDSFHGTVFSIIFKKNFTVFKRNYDDNLNQTSRILSLLNKINLGDCYCEAIDIFSPNNSIDYEEVDIMLNELKNNSIEFLKNALRNVEKYNKGLNE